jgi:hypothetical protein
MYIVLAIFNSVEQMNRIFVLAITLTDVLVCSIGKEILISYFLIFIIQFLQNIIVSCHIKKKSNSLRKVKNKILCCGIVKCKKEKGCRYRCIKAVKVEEKKKASLTLPKKLFCLNVLLSFHFHWLFKEVLHRNLFAIHYRLSTQFNMLIKILHLLMNVLALMT